MRVRNWRTSRQQAAESREKAKPVKKEMYQNVLEN
jgi:hypothetical protein